jgi:hypothetical protein
MGVTRLAVMNHASRRRKRGSTLRGGQEVWAKVTRNCQESGSECYGLVSITMFVSDHSLDDSSPLTEDISFFISEDGSPFHGFRGPKWYAGDLVDMGQGMITLKPGEKEQASFSLLWNGPFYTEGRAPTGGFAFPHAGTYFVKVRVSSKFLRLDQHAENISAPSAERLFVPRARSAHLVQWTMPPRICSMPRGWDAKPQMDPKLRQNAR